MIEKTYYDVLRKSTDKKEHGRIHHDYYKFTNTQGLESDLEQILEDAPVLEVYQTDKDGNHIKRVMW